MRFFRHTPALLAVLFTAAAGLVSCQKEKTTPPAQTAVKTDPAPAAALPPPPPPAPVKPPAPPDTSLGKLIEVQRSNKTAVLVLCENKQGLSFVTTGKEVRNLRSDESGALHAAKGTAVIGMLRDAGRIPGSGAKTKSLTETAPAGKTFLILRLEGKSRRDQSDQMADFVSMSASEYLARVDEQSWLSDSGGTRYKGFRFDQGGKRQLAFQIPNDATGLVWHDGKKKAYELEPHPQEILEAPSAGKTKP